jgi:hypothetical protein
MPSSPNHRGAREIEWGARTRAAAAVLVRMGDACVGADLRNPGLYAVSFMDGEGREFRSVGRFASVKAAAEAVPFIVAETALEEVDELEVEPYG